MSASDYINLKRLKRTAANNTQVASGKLTEYTKINDVRCIYNSRDDGKLFNYFNIVSNTNDNLDTCIENNYVAPEHDHSVLTKLPIIQQTPYIKNRTIQRKFCFKHPLLHSGVSEAAMLRVCGVANTTIHKI